MTGSSDGTATLLCDLDGTLVNSAPDLLSALNSLLRERNRPAIALPALTRMVGDGARKLVERGFAATGERPEPSDLDGLVTRFLEHYENDLVRETVLFPHAEQTLTELRTQGWRLVVCTNKPERHSRQILKALGVSHLFDAISGGDSHAFKKPDPRHLLAALDLIAAPTAGCVVLGDSANDARAGQDAGIPVVLVSFGYSRTPLSGLGADRVIDSFVELPATLGEMAAARRGAGPNRPAAPHTL